MFTKRFHRVKSVDEAVELAIQFKEKGVYDLFRGQTKNWHLKSSYARLEEGKKNEALEKMRRFVSWIKRTRGLEPLAKCPDDAIAVSQHYGLPTNFIDFTTNPRTAGYFASFERNQDENNLSCILCLNSKDLMRFWESMPSEYPPPEILYLKIQNLWRLEAQAGVFLFCPYDEFEHIYDFDRIFFPYTGLVSGINKEDIYPIRKSQLEILLDQYFMNELLIEGEKSLPPNLNWITMSKVEEKCSKDLCLNGNPPPILSSWDNNNIAPWLIHDNEEYLKTICDEIWEITVNLDENLNLMKHNILNYLKMKLNTNPNARNRLINWSIRIVGVQMRKSGENKIAALINRLWDGLRKLPYEEQDIAESLTNCIVLITYLLKRENNTKIDWQQITSDLFSETIWIEFGSEDGSYSRSYVSKSKLLAAVRDDIYDYIAPAWIEQIIGNIIGLLQAIWAPSRLFDFNKLSKLYAQEILPVQILMRADNVAIFFSPARLDSFGLP